MATKAFNISQLAPKVSVTGTVDPSTGVTPSGSNGNLLTIVAGVWASAVPAVPATITATAGTGAANYLLFSSAATGSVAVTTNSLLTYNYTNNTLLDGIKGGAF